MTLDALATVERAERPLAGVLTVPGSKSLTNRAFVIAALADGVTTLHGALEADDTARMRELVTSLGATVRDHDGALHVTGTAGDIRATTDEIFVGQSGTTMRFGTALAALSATPVQLIGSKDLHARPVGSLVDALSSLGATITTIDGRPPVSVRPAALRGGRVEVAGSSQFASALLMIGPYLDGGLEVVAAGAGAFGYVELTADMMRHFGAQVVADGHRWTVSPGATYHATTLQVAPDVSGACHIWALAMATAGQVTVRHAASALAQPDGAILEVFTQMGGRVARNAGDVTVTGPADIAPIDVDVHALPDQLPTIAALAALSRGTSTIHGAEVTRGHETDRIRAMAVELRKCGATVDELADGLRVTGPAVAPVAPIDTYHDHRIAMAFTALGARLGATVISDPHCVAKTYPTFWSDVQQVGTAVHLTAAP